jgi:hypothetical protein
MEDMAARMLWQKTVLKSDLDIKLTKKIELISPPIQLAKKRTAPDLSTDLIQIALDAV